MIKLLHISSGEYVQFLSSNEYDMKHPDDKSERVLNYEDSYVCAEGTSFEDAFSTLFPKGGAYVPSEPNKILSEFVKFEFEIIYD
jgi:hypothetical protein